MDKVRVGLVGIGGMGSVHYDCYGSIEDAEVVAVCEACPELAKEKTAGKDVKIYSDLNEMLSSEALDVVDICTPSYMHADMAIECLKRGFNVLCEKPMTLTEDDCERVLQAVKVSGKKFMTAHVVRFMAPYAYLKETLNSKKYGSLVELSLRRLSAVPSWSWNDWMRNEKLSGGVCLDLCVHDLDFVQSGLGMPQKTYSVLRPKVIDKLAKLVADKFNAELSTPTVLLSLKKELKEVTKSINGIMAAIENGIFTKTTKERLLNLEATQADLENKIAVEEARQVKPLQPNEVKKFLTYFAYMKYEKGEEKNEFISSFINRVILYDDKVIILYNSNDREIKRLDKKQLKDIENAENLEDIKENSSEPRGFKRVALGGEREI